MTNVQSKPAAENEYPPFQMRKCTKKYGEDSKPCPGTTALAICRGRNKEADKGRWYERCDVDESHPELRLERHFIRWCTEYPAYTPLKELTILLLCDPKSTPPSSPLKPHPNQSPLQPHPEPDEDDSNLDPALRDDVEFLVTGQTRLPGSPISAPGSTSLPLPTDAPNSTQLAQSAKCQGPLCVGPGTAMKPAKACTFKMCKRCCLHHQLDISKPCKIHRLEAGSQAQIAATHVGLPDSTAPALSQDGFYDRSKPLTAEHYQRKMAAQAQAGNNARVNHIAEKAKLANRFERQIEILFWDKNDPEPQNFTVVPENHPHFALANCPSGVLERLHLSPTSEDHTDLIETLDPSTGRWTSHQLETVRNVTDVKTLLYRALGVKNGELMNEEVQKLTSRDSLAKSRKRPVIESDFQDLEEPSKRQRLSIKHDRLRSQSSLSTSTLPTLSRRRHHTSISESEALSVTDSDSESDLDIQLTDRHRSDQSESPPPSLRPTTSIRRASSPSLPPVHNAFPNLLRRVETPPVTTSQASLPTIDYTRQPFGHDLDMMPSSLHGHALFPLKYVIAMGRFFERVKSMGSGSLEHRFSAAFPSGFHVPAFPKSGYHAASSMWTDEKWDHLRKKYLRGGYTNKGLWKDFVKEVNKLKDEEKKGKSKSRKIAVKIEDFDGYGAGPSGVKLEPQEASTSLEFSHEYVVLNEGGKEYLIIDDE